MIKINRLCLMSWLTGLGAVPFVILTLGLIPDFSMGFSQAQLLRAQTSYGVVICSFMSGVCWGLQLNAIVRGKVFLVLLSNAIALAVWFSYLFLSATNFLIVLAVLFLILLVVDIFIYVLGGITKAYLQLRCAVTGLVVLSLISSWVIA